MFRHPRTARDRLTTQTLIAAGACLGGTIAVTDGWVGLTVAGLAVGAAVLMGPVVGYLGAHILLVLTTGEVTLLEALLFEAGSVPLLIVGHDGVSTRVATVLVAGVSLLLILTAGILQVLGESLPITATVVLAGTAVAAYALHRYSLLTLDLVAVPETETEENA